jgi:uncharacterized glyoxalase superfamily protein PhnB
MNFKPIEYSSVSPYLIVSVADATIQFMMAVFGGREIRRFSDEQGRVMHAEVRIDDTVIMLADCTDDWPAVHANVHVYVPSVDDIFQHALTAGASSVQKPVKKNDDDKRSGVFDPGRTTWWIATKVTKRILTR